MFGYRSTVSGTGFAEEMLAPPVETIDLEVTAGAIVDGAVMLRPPSPTSTVRADGTSEIQADGTSETQADGTSETQAGVEPLSVGGRFGLVARPARRDQDQVIAEAVAAAATADVAVVVVGLTEVQETESVDKTTLHLPGAQDAMVSAVAAAAKRTVVVVSSATPVIMPWLGQVDAVLWAGLPGQEGGHAVAAALLGDIEPAGRLVTSFPVQDGAARRPGR